MLGLCGWAVSRGRGEGNMCVWKCLPTMRCQVLAYLEWPTTDLWHMKLHAEPVLGNKVVLVGGDPAGVLRIFNLDLDDICKDAKKGGSKAAIKASNTLDDVGASFSTPARHVALSQDLRHLVSVNGSNLICLWQLPSS